MVTAEPVDLDEPEPDRGGAHQARPSTVSRPVRWITSAGAVFSLVAIVYALSPVRLVDYDPSFAPLAASSLVADGDLNLDEYPPDALVGHPLATQGGGEVTWNVYPDRAAVEAARSGASSYDYFPWITAVWLVPAVAATDVLAAMGVGAPAREQLAAGGFDVQHQMTAGLITAGAAVFVLLTARALLAGPEPRRRLLACGVSFAFAFGTTAWSISSRAMWQHAPSLLFATGALFCLVQLSGFGPDRPRASRPALAAVMGVAVTLAVVSRPTNVWLAGAVSVWLLLRRRDLILQYFGAAAVCAAVFLALNDLMFGSLLPLYYSGSRVELHGRVGEAFAAQWVSPSRGLIWTSPFLLLAVPGVVVAWRRRWDRLLLSLLVAVPVGVAFSSSAFANWWAGHSFGARFMTEAVPVLVLLSVPAVDRLVPRSAAELRHRWAGLLVLFALVVPAVIVNGAASARAAAWCWNTSPVDVDADPARIWSLTDGQPATVVLDLVGRSTESRC